MNDVDIDRIRAALDIQTMSGASDWIKDLVAAAEGTEHAEAVRAFEEAYRAFKALDTPFHVGVNADRDPVLTRWSVTGELPRYSGWWAQAIDRVGVVGKCERGEGEFIVVSADGQPTRFFGQAVGWLLTNMLYWLLGRDEVTRRRGYLEPSEVPLPLAKEDFLRRVEQ